MMKSKQSTPTLSRNIVLAIDPGFDRLGVAVLEKRGGKENLLFSKCIVTNPKDLHNKRLLDIGLGVREIISEWKPTSLAIETLFFNQNISSALGVAQARGVVIFEASSAGLEVCEYAPQAIKVAVTGYGKATKSQMKSMIDRLIDIPKSVKKLDDELDAIAVGITHLASKRDI
jgi:crossover junction endodeoxyribonuclease RuvC